MLGLHSQQLVPLFGATKQCSSKNKKIEGGVGLRWPPFYDAIYNNQPIIGVCGFNDDRAEARPGQSIWGGAVALFWPSNKRQK